MRPVPLNDRTVEQLGGGRRRVLAAPNGDLLDPNISPLEVLVQQTADGRILVNSVWTLDADDRQQLAAGGHVRLSVSGGQPPVALTVLEGDRVVDEHAGLAVVEQAILEWLRDHPETRATARLTRVAERLTDQVASNLAARGYRLVRE